MSASAAPGTHIERLQVLSDAALTRPQLQHIGQTFGAALDAELAGAGVGRLELGELVLDLRGAPSLQTLARSTAALILGRLTAPAD